MSFKKIEFGFAHQQRDGFNVHYTVDPYKPRQRPRLHVVPDGKLPTVEQVAKPDYLLQTFYGLKQNAGWAPGPDGIDYGSIGRSAAAGMMRLLSKEMLSGKYAHGPTRNVNIPKKGGFRTLKLANLSDRVASAALNRAITSYWESVFLPRSVGFRPEKNCLHLLAGLEADVLTTKSSILVVDDVRKAFDNVLIANVMAIHKEHIGDTSLLALIETVLWGSEGVGRSIGIDQGSAYSPTALNVLLHHAHDLWACRGLLHWWRYADNLIYLCRSLSEGKEILERAREQLQRVGLSLKGEDGPPKDLANGDTAQILGFTISGKPGGLKFQLGLEALAKLQDNLIRSHESPNPSKTAYQAVMGWFSYLGPALESERDSVLEQVLTLTANHGYREINPDDMMKRWEWSGKRWNASQAIAQKRAFRLNCSTPPDSGRRYRARPSMQTTQMPSAAEDCGVMARSPVGKSPESANPGSEGTACVPPPLINPVYLEVASPLLSESPISREVETDQSRFTQPASELEPGHQFERVGESVPSTTDQPGIRRAAPLIGFSAGEDCLSESASNLRSVVGSMGGRRRHSHFGWVRVRRAKARDPPGFDGVKIADHGAVYNVRFRTGSSAAPST